MEWKPISTCPDNTSVMFFYNGTIVTGRMKHNTRRMGGQHKDYYWGGWWAIEADDNPPTHWMPLPDPPQETQQ